MLSLKDLVSAKTMSQTVLQKEDLDGSSCCYKYLSFYNGHLLKYSHKTSYGNRSWFLTEITKKELLMSKPIVGSENRSNLGTSKV